MRSNRHPITCLILLLPLLVWGCDGGEKGERPSEHAEANIDAAQLHSRLLTVDTHVDISNKFATTEEDPGMRGGTQVDLVKMAEGNLNTIFFIVYVEQGERTDEGYALATAQAMQKFRAIHRMTEDMHPDKIGLATKVDDIHRLRSQNKFAALIGVENGFAFGKDLSLVQAYYDLGMRYAGFAHFGHSNFADSSMPKSALGDMETEYGGLSDLGRDLLRELNRLGVMADVSHASKQATLEIARLSTAPVIASHSGVYALNPHPRNLTDEELVAIKDTGGVVQIVAYDTYLKDPPQEKKDAMGALRVEFGLDKKSWSALTDLQKQTFRERANAMHEVWPKANISDFVDHIDYAVNLIGIDHVGISSDFGGGGGVTGWGDASETAAVTAELVERGYKEDQIRKLWGENFLRVMAEVQSLADEAKISTEAAE